MVNNGNYNPYSGLLRLAGQVGDAVAVRAVDVSQSTSTTFMFEPVTTAEDIAVFECALDEAVYALCDSPWTVEDVSNGEHTVKVRAINDLGGQDPAPATFSWTVRVTALETLITDAPSQSSPSATRL